MSGTVVFRLIVRLLCFALLIGEAIGVLAQSPHTASPFDAVSNSSQAEFATYLATGGDANARDASGSLLEHASSSSQPAIVELLLEHGADANADSGEPLSLAVQKGNLEVTHALLAHGADPNSVGSGHPPLVEAAASDLRDIAEALLEAKANPDAADALGRTALTAASERDYTEVVALLLKFHANPNLSDASGETPLIWASGFGYPSLVQELLQAHADANGKDRIGNTPLMSACVFGHERIVALLVDAGADVNAQNQIGNMPILIAASEGSPDIAALLMAKGAKQTGRINGKSAQDLAKANGNDEVLTVLRTGIRPETFPKEFTLAAWGVQPHELRRELLDSFIFRDIFLLSRSTPVGSAMELQRNEFADLNEQLQSLFASAKYLVGIRRADIEKSLGHLIPVDDTKLALIDSGTAQAYTVQSGSNASGNIAIDVKLLQANILASIASLRQDEGKEVTLSGLLEDRRNIENLAVLDSVHLTSNRVGQYGMSLSNSTALTNVMDLHNYAQKFEPIGVDYYGTLLFIIAHELGHVALGHGLNSKPCPQRELDADTFAAFVLSEPLMAMSVQAVNVSFANLPTMNGNSIWLDEEDLQSYTGFSLFFGKSYELANFGPSNSACVYPEPSQRLNASKSAIEKVRAEEEAQLLKAVRKRKDLPSS